MLARWRGMKRLAGVWGSAGLSARAARKAKSLFGSSPDFRAPEYCGEHGHLLPSLCCVGDETIGILVATHYGTLTDCANGSQ